VQKTEAATSIGAEDDWQMVEEGFVDETEEGWMEIKA